MTYRYPVSQPSLGTAERDRVEGVLRSGWLTQGPCVATFERALAGALHVNHVVACSNGTTALHLALLALGLGPGMEVLVPDLTFVAAANAIAYTGATPVLVDVDPDSWNIDLADAEDRITSKTKAILPVHLYGVPCDMDALTAFAEQHGLFVIEDAAEALGGAWQGRACGTIGDVGTFSFYGNKILTTGEGGALVTNDDALAERARFLRGQAMDPVRRYYHPEVGYNYRMTDLHAAVGLGQLARLEEMLATRRGLCRRYQQALLHVGQTSMSACLLSSFAPWLYTQVFDEPRDRIVERLARAGIETRPTFVPLHRLPMYAGHDADFLGACQVGDRGLSFPTYVDLPVTAVDEICDLICGQ